MWHKKNHMLAHTLRSRLKAYFSLHQFQERFEELNKESTSERQSPKKKKKLNHLLHELDTDSNNSDNVSDNDADNQDLTKPWLPEFHRFLKTEHVLADGIIASNPLFWAKHRPNFGPSNLLFLDKKWPELPGAYPFASFSQLTITIPVTITAN